MSKPSQGGLELLDDPAARALPTGRTGVLDVEELRRLPSSIAR
jgi:hypothetical protein